MMTFKLMLLRVVPYRDPHPIQLNRVRPPPLRLQHIHRRQRPVAHLGRSHYAPPHVIAQLVRNIKSTHKQSLPHQILRHLLRPIPLGHRCRTPALRGGDARPQKHAPPASSASALPAKVRSLCPPELPSPDCNRQTATNCGFSHTIWSLSSANVPAFALGTRA